MCSRARALLFIFHSIYSTRHLTVNGIPPSRRSEAAHNHVKSGKITRIGGVCSMVMPTTRGIPRGANVQNLARRYYHRNKFTANARTILCALVNIRRTT